METIVGLVWRVVKPTRGTLPAPSSSTRKVLLAKTIPLLYEEGTESDCTPPLCLLCALCSHLPRGAPDSSLLEATDDQSFRHTAFAEPLAPGSPRGGSERTMRDIVSERCGTLPGKMAMFDHLGAPQLHRVP